MDAEKQIKRLERVASRAVSAANAIANCDGTTASRQIRHAISLLNVVQRELDKLHFGPRVGGRAEGAER